MFGSDPTQVQSAVIQTMIAEKKAEWPPSFSYITAADSAVNEDFRFESYLGSGLIPQQTGEEATCEGGLKFFVR